MSLPRVAVIGPECTGKTTLARALAEHYGTIWVPEYARRWVEATGRPPTERDVEMIARGQIEAEERAAREADRLLVLDTDLLSTVVYARHYFGEVAAWIEAEAERRRPELYLRSDIDVPWVPDGHQRARPEEREGLHDRFREAVEASGAPHRPVRGRPEARLAEAVAAIDELLAPGRRPTDG